MAFDLNTALDKLPRKGKTEFPYKGWLVEEDLHEWAQDQGYLTGCIFKRPKSRGKGRKAKWQYRLLLVDNCPWNSNDLRFYTASL
ncbi:hypothetical protein N9917_03195 [Deltaproteobacteria bacterium]|nr:hypothetical protein [Deltaproteobacteria bacterium]